MCINVCLAAIATFTAVAVCAANNVSAQGGGPGGQVPGPPVMSHSIDNVVHAVEDVIGEQLYGPGDELAVVAQISWSTPINPQLDPDKVLFSYDLDWLTEGSSASLGNHFTAGSDRSGNYVSAGGWTVESTDPVDWVAWDMDTIVTVSGSNPETYDYEQFIFWLSSEHGGSPPVLP